MRQSHSVHVIETKIANALQSLRKVMDSELAAQPVSASNQPHSYNDKFALAESVLSLAIASWLGVLEALGLERTALLQLSAAARAGQRVTLRITSEEGCKLLRKEQREIEGATKVQETSTLLGTTETKIIRTETDHVFLLTHKFEVCAFIGASPGAMGAGGQYTLMRRSASGEVVTRRPAAPKPELVMPPPSDCDISWLLARLTPPADGAAAATLSLSIDRADAECRSPRRNRLVTAALDAAREFHEWCGGLRRLYDVAASADIMATGGATRRASVESLGEIFVPVLPLMQAATPLDEPNADESTDAPPLPPPAATEEAPEARAPEETEGSTVVRIDLPVAEATQAEATDEPRHALSSAALTSILALERTSMSERRAATAAAFGDDGGLLTFAEVWAAVLAQHARSSLTQLEESIAYIEGLLRLQLVAAIGRELTASDFAAYMRHHAHKLLQPNFAPRPFCFAVRQQDRSPDGTVAFESKQQDGSFLPVETIVRSMAEPSPPMTFALDAATRVSFHGERHLHCLIAHSFGSAAATDTYQLAVRARQFSSYLVLVGRLGANGTFEPKHGMIARNKDELKLPIMLEQLPSAKAFADAIASLSPEQQRFAKAYRGMQLEGSVFGVLIVQLRPQLERLLRLPADALTKEIALTQRLLELFIEFQIPSDLFAYDGPADASTAEKLKAVTAHVQAIYDTLDAAKQAEIDGAKQRHQYAHPHVSPSDEEEEETMGFDLFGDACKSAGYGGMSMQGMVKGGGKGGMRMARCAPRGAMGGAMGGCARSACAAAPPAACMMAAPPPPAATCMANPAPPPATPKPCVASSSAPAATADGAKAGMEPPAMDDEYDDVGGSVELDYTRVPLELDAKLEALDVDGAVRPTRIDVGKAWSKRAQPALLGKPTTSTLLADEQAKEKQKAFDLLDAISRSGALPLECCALHVVIAATHCFDQSLVDTIIEKNVNPIEKLEKTLLLVSECIQAQPAARLVRPEVYDRVAMYAAPALLPPRHSAEEAAE